MLAEVMAAYADQDAVLMSRQSYVPQCNSGTETNLLYVFNDKA